jgi:hypothetical protein
MLVLVCRLLSPLHGYSINYWCLVGRKECLLCVSYVLPLLALCVCVRMRVHVCFFHSKNIFVICT